MSSILTNLSAITAVQNLAATQKSLADVQNQISTGLSVSSAKDNAAYFSIAQTMRTSVSNLSAVSSSLNLGSSVVSTATAATNQITSILQQISSNLVTAKSNLGNTTTQSYLQTAITALNQQLASIVSSASFNGTNLLDGSAGASVSFVSGITGSGANTNVNSLTINTSGTNLNGSAYTGTDVKISNAFTAAANLAAATTANTTAQANLSLATSANNSAASALSTAIGNLTSADLGNGTVASGAGDAAFQAAFGVHATLSNNVISGIDANSLAGALVGAGSDATITLSPPNTYPNTGPAGATVSTYANGATGGGTLGALFGANATKTSTAGAAGSIAQLAVAATVALGSATANNANAQSALSPAETSTYNQIANGALFSVGQISLNSNTTAAQIDAYIKQVGTAVTSVNTAAEQLGAASKQIDLQTTYISSLSGSLTQGVGSLVDADMNEASTRLSALQTQQQLGVQALSTANQNSQLILKLFQG